MKWTEEYKETIKQKVRSILIRKPNASQYELAKILEIDKNTALKLKKEVYEDNLKRLDDQKIEGEVGRLEDEYNELALECWRIITESVRRVKRKNDEGVEVEVEEVISTKDKLGAIRALTETKKALFGIKFDAGIFSRKLGELDIKKELSDEDKQLLEQALSYGKIGTENKGKNSE